jgi:hypothetical protein
MLGEKSLVEGALVVPSLADNPSFKDFMRSSKET